ncbi:flagellar hook protein FlgE [Oleiagrimonas sp. C23AA]|uniref:flagellar hook protein FlgE n=1 Tax=Oleiagrimonas sp. C23AA TaxID=2719047 RepID=UPI001422FB39|nr:flagellar hook protein FlgE [Oleiagrimonas sp. C23AA]NII09211.1 flagellar hook protein FlgE [Oleiagrimonas sp. C23AA]
MPFNIALSGLSAASSDLEVTANNIANTATTGFKGSRAEFAELYSAAGQDLSKSQIGSGVEVTNIAQQFNAGNIETTNNSLDFAISGSGFFVMHDGKGYSYTRAGAFQQDRNGYVVNSAGQNLQVFPPNGTGGFDTSTLNDLQVSTTQLSAQATNGITLNLNLPSTATAPTTTPFSPTDSSSYNQSAPFTVYDSLGNTHSATAYFVKNAATNTWDVNLYVDGQQAGTQQQVAFDTSGKITTPANGQLNFGSLALGNGSNPLTLSLDMSNTTQTGGTYALTSVNQDGYAPGSYSGLNVSADGIVSATYSNGQSRALGQVALASFANPQGLNQIDNTSWAATLTSGDAVLGSAGSGKMGTVQSGALESSNTSDLTGQLVNMIRAQRNYQANAKVISTDDQLTKTIINMTT